jgi:hypothetical protein
MVKDAKMTKRRKMQIDEEQARFWNALHILLNIYINTEDTLYVIGT